MKQQNMQDIAITNTDSIAKMSQSAIEKVCMFEQLMLTLPQVVMPVTHTLHGGVYSRTLTIPAGVVITGGFIQVPTTLIINGRGTIYANDETMEVNGYKVIVASAGRKQIYSAHEDTTGTMFFATNAKTVEEAENEFTMDAYMLLSRTHEHLNTEIITGE
jgi:hypothetical protein